jgi:hypothetical protein
VDAAGANDTYLSLQFTLGDIAEWALVGIFRDGKNEAIATQAKCGVSGFTVDFGLHGRHGTAVAKASLVTLNLHFRLNFAVPHITAVVEGMR